MKTDVCVIGAGIIGIVTALELQERGVEVLLVDRGEPGLQTSFGNAGVLSVSTVLNVNNPGLFRAAPKLLAGAMPYFDYNFSYALSRLGWLGAFFLSVRFASLLIADSACIARPPTGINRKASATHHTGRCT